MRLTSRGSKRLVEDGTINIYDKIQSHKDECEVKIIVARALAGDPEAIMRVNGTRKTYGDTTQIPKTLLEAKQMIIDAENSFYKLPKELREQFGNNIDKFLAAADAGEINEEIMKYLKKHQPNEYAKIQQAEKKAEQTKVETETTKTSEGEVL